MSSQSSRLGCRPAAVARRPERMVSLIDCRHERQDEDMVTLKRPYTLADTRAWSSRSCLVACSSAPEVRLRGIQTSGAGLVRHTRVFTLDLVESTFSM